MRGLPQGIWVISISGFFVTMGFGLVAPILPSLGEQYGVGISAMSVAISGFAGVRLTVNLILSKAAHRVSLRNTFDMGLAFQGVVTFAAGFAPDYWSFVLLRCISGAGSAAFTISSTALLVALAPAAKRGAAASLYATSTALGTVAGPVFGAALAVVSPQLPLFVYGTLLLIALLISRLLLKNAADVRTTNSREISEVRGPAKPRSMYLQILQDRAVLAVLMCQLVHGWVYYGMRTAILPSYLEGLGHAISFIGLLLAVAAFTQLLSSMVGGMLSDRFGRVGPLSAALVGAGLSVALLPLAGSATIAIASFVIVGVAAGCQISISTALLADSPLGRTSEAAGMFWITFDAAAIVGPLLTGLLLEKLGIEWALGAAVVVVAVAFLITLRARKASR